MKKKIILGFIGVMGVLMLFGCSQDSLRLFQKDKEKSLTAVQYQKPEGDPPEKVIIKADEMVDQMVAKINAGNWQEAINVGENVYAALIQSELIIKKKKIHAPNLITVKEKLLETLVEAYDYKNIASGLSEEEKDLYVRTAREHLKINPADHYKKLALSQVLLAAGKIDEGFKLASEVYKSPVKNKDITENYAWALYLSGKKTDAYNIYKTIYAQSETLSQLYHSAVVIEEFDKLLGLILYKGCEKAGNNLMVLEANVKNLSAQSTINIMINKAQKSADRLLVGGFRIDSKFNMESIDAIVKSIVKLSKN